MKLASAHRCLGWVRRHRVERGLSLVELMVGATIGLFVVAAASMLVGTQLGENRKLILETQLGQDLRATADIIARELRRSGNSHDPWNNIATETSSATYNDRSEISTVGGIDFMYDREGTANRGQRGFKLEGGVIKTRLAPQTSYQELTDPATMEVTSFQIVQRVIPEQTLPCPRLCPGTNSTDCWPKLFVRAFTVTIEARSPNNPEVVRSLQSEVRLRNDQVKFFALSPAGPGGPTTVQACPS
jgi:type II secretory pathway component PulJ